MGRNSVSPSMTPRMNACRPSPTRLLRKGVARGGEIGDDGENGHPDGGPEDEGPQADDPVDVPPVADGLEDEADGDALDDHLGLAPDVGRVGPAARLGEAAEAADQQLAGNDDDD